MESGRYQQLVNNIEVLRRGLLPTPFDPTGTYADADKAHLRASSFRVLSHAEIEAFLEDRAQALFESAWSEWEARRIPSRTIIALLAFSPVETFEPSRRLGRDPQNQRAYDDLAVPVARAQAVWRHAKVQNNGLKEENVVRLFLPLGVRPDQLDSTLLADLSSFGVDRGKLAHASAVGVKEVADPQTEYQRVHALVRALKDLDLLVEDYIREVASIRAALGPSAPETEPSAELLGGL